MLVWSLPPLLAHLACTWRPPLAAGSSGGVAFGRDQTFQSNYLQGSLGPVLVYKAALSGEGGAEAVHPQLA